MTRILGIVGVVAGAATLYAAAWLHDQIGWLARVVFVAAGLCGGVGLAFAAAPVSAGYVFGEAEEGAEDGTLAGRVIARASVVVGVAVGLGVWFAR